MKKFSLFLIVILLVSAASSFQQVTAQEKTKAEQEKEQKIQQEIDQQKKAMTEQKKAQSESEADLLDQQAAKMDNNMKDVRVIVESGDKTGENVMRYMPRGNRSFAFDEPFDFSGPDMQTFYRHSMGGDSERTTWDFSKSVKEKTFSTDYTFNIEKSVNTVVMSVMGDCKTGEIRIRIVMPNGKNYSDILIDESGNLNWRKSFTISETENQDKTGDWKFQISSAKATGFFKISLQSF
jgi:hypothetical protein